VAPGKGKDQRRTVLVRAVAQGENIFSRFDVFSFSFSCGRPGKNQGSVNRSHQPGRRGKETGLSGGGLKNEGGKRLGSGC